MTNDTKKEWTPGKRIRHGLIYGFCTALLVLVLEGALRDYVVEGAFHLKLGTTAGGLMLGVLMAAVEFAAKPDRGYEDIFLYVEDESVRTLFEKAGFRGGRRGGRKG